MDIEAHQTMFFSHQSNLLFPQLGRPIPEYMEQRVILCCCQRQLHQMPDKVRHHRTTPAPLWFQVTYVGYRHVVGERQVSVPLDIAIHHGRSESGGFILLGILVDPFHLSLKFLSVAE